MSVRRDKKGRWSVCIQFQEPDGKTRRIERTSAQWTRQQAEKWECDALATLAEGASRRRAKEEGFKTRLLCAAERRMVNSLRTILRRTLSWKEGAR